MISIITPSIRPEMLEIVAKCLKRQTFRGFEWIVITPTQHKICNNPFFAKIIGCENYKFDERSNNGVTYAYLDEKESISFDIYSDPAKKEGDYYNLNKAWNKAFQEANDCDLIVSIVDGLWFEPTLLEKLWNHYETNPKAIVGAVGNQYDQLLNGKPEHMVWRDPRIRTDFGSFYEVESTEVEWCIASIPRKAIFAVGGMDEEYDKGAALSEKEANLRMQKAGYSLFLDQSIEYRAIHHPRLSKEWDEKYRIASELYAKHVHDILEGKRLRLDFLKKESNNVDKVSL